MGDWRGRALGVPLVLLLLLLFRLSLRRKLGRLLRDDAVRLSTRVIIVEIENDQHHGQVIEKIES
jgi:hypothetical protein